MIEVIVVTYCTYQERDKQRRRVHAMFHVAEVEEGFDKAYRDNGLHTALWKNRQGCQRKTRRKLQTQTHLETKVRGVEYQKLKYLFINKNLPNC